MPERNGLRWSTYPDFRNPYGEIVATPKYGWEVNDVSDLFHARPLPNSKELKAFIQDYLADKIPPTGNRTEAFMDVGSTAAGLLSGSTLMNVLSKIVPGLATAGTTMKAAKTAVPTMETVSSLQKAFRPRSPAGDMLGNDEMRLAKQLLNELEKMPSWW